MNNINHLLSKHMKLEAFHQLLERQAELTPSTVAITYYENSLTYQEYNDRANQFAKYLQSIGIREGTPVGLYVDRSLELPIILMGVLKCGAICVPIDVDTPPERIKFIVEDAALSHVVVHPTQLEFHGYPSIQIICYNETNLSHYSIDNLSLPILSSDIAYILFTSGSTGRPKGVILEHKGFINTCIAMANLLSNDIEHLRLLQFSSIGFDAIIPEIGIPILRGGTLVITKKIDQLPGKPMIDTINNNKISIIILLPSILKVMQDAQFPYLKIIMSIGEVYPPIIANKLKSRFILFNTYGPTEASVAVTSYKIDENLEYTTTVPIGKPLGNAELCILDSDLKPVQKGEVGELYIGGIGLARGYINPEQTAKSFVNVFGKRLYKTGDFVRMLEEGNIEYIGRRDRQIKFHGIRISLNEIEIALSEHECIAIAAAIYKDGILSVYIQLKSNKELDEVTLRAYLRNKLPAGVLPHKCVFLSCMPLNLNGKTDYPALVQYQDKPTTSMCIDDTWSNDERTLYDILQRLFNPGQIKLDTSFFDMGLDSFSIVGFSEEVNKAFHVDIRVAKFYEYPNIRALVEYIQGVRANITEAAIDFKKEVRINEVLTKQQYVNDNKLVPKNILLTGATGFLGIFLLEELLNNTDSVIYCLVRAKDKITALQRINDTARKYQIILDEAKCLSQLRVIPSDITKALFGLDKEQYVSLNQTINTIHHVASDVSFIKPYAALKPTNVFGSEEILRFATNTKVIPVHYVSTLSVFSCRHFFDEEFSQIYETTDTTESVKYLQYEIGYVQSKWVADQLMQQAMDRGVPVTIYRPGLILCHSKTGAMASQQFWHCYTSECLRLGVYADLIEQHEEFISVDYTAKAIFYLSQRNDASGKIYHLCPQDFQNISSTTFITEMMRLMGCDLKALPYSTWL